MVFALILIKYLKINMYKNIKDFENAITEGLITTYNINTATHLLRKWFDELTKDFNIEILDNDTFKITIKDKISTSLFQTLIADINNMGYFPSIIELENENNLINKFKYDFDKINNIIMSKNIIQMILICEKKFDDIVNITFPIYHICKSQNITKILKIGLCPKTKNRIGSHPERIYFCLHVDNCINLIKKFDLNDIINKQPEQLYTILEINIPNSKKIIFRKDPNMIDNGIYTYENISSEYIKIKYI